MTKSERITAYREFMPKPKQILYNRLDTIGFFDAPASTKYHGAYEGGLFDHSLEVAKTLVDLTDKLGLKWERTISPYIVGMFHDLCKCDNYVEIKSFEEVAPIGIKYKYNPGVIIAIINIQHFRKF